MSRVVGLGGIDECDGWDRGRLVGAFICFCDARFT